MKKIIIAGGSGFIGKALQQHYQSQGHQVIILGRSSKELNGFLKWDGKNVGDWKSALENADLLINLSGKSVDCRYTEQNKKKILDSRVQSTEALQQAVNQCKKLPKVWMNASTATIYKDNREQANTELSNEIGNDFSMTVAKKWEEAFFKTQNEGVRKVALRISLVLSNSGGVLPVLSRLAKFGFGGKMGDGQQKFAHIELEELIRVIDFIEATKTLEGPINCTNTKNLTNEEFMSKLRKDLNIKFYMNVPQWLLTLGGKIIGTEKELILKSRFVEPDKLIKAGFIFNH